jgi:hypothetical protein
LVAGLGRSHAERATERRAEQEADALHEGGRDSNCSAGVSSLPATVTGFWIVSPG